MRSMTGYGKAESESCGRKVTVELKSVNHRFFDLNIKVPKLFNSFEDAVRQMLSSIITRGHVDVYINYVDRAEKNKEVIVDTALAKAMVQAAKKLETELELKNDLTALAILKTNDVIKIVENDEETAVWKDLLLSTVKKACGQLNKMRDYEGQKLKDDLTDTINATETIVKKIDGLKAAAVKECSAKLKARIRELLEGVPFDEAKFVNEVAYLADKSAIDEETMRLFVHIEHFRKMLKEEAVGKRLDFLTQELNREANTICSKAVSTKITELGLKLKSEIEKIREQVQNAE